MRVLKSHKCAGGLVRFWEHDSKFTKTKMAFSTFTPEGEVAGCLIWLSGLTCTEENFMAKAGAQKYLAENQLMVICPDTSPRGLNLPKERDHWDFGAGASFYVNATTEGYRDHYRMYDYVARELYQLIVQEFKVEKISIFGHSMGGHGALVIGLREEGKFKSVSAFSPIVNPAGVPWGEKAFTGYLGDDRSVWEHYDTCALLKSGASHPNPILIDQGTADNFLEKELVTDRILEANRDHHQKLEVRYQEGYDHSYYFISTFIRDHIRFHASYLKD